MWVAIIHNRKGTHTEVCSNRSEAEQWVVDYWNWWEDQLEGDEYYAENIDMVRYLRHDTEGRFEFEIVKRG